MGFFSRIIKVAAIGGIAYAIFRRRPAEGTEGTEGSEDE